MDGTRWQRAAGVGGILFVVLTFVVVLWAPLSTSTPEPAFDGAARDWLAYARATHNQILPLTPVSILALFGFAVFAVGLALRLRRPDGRSGAPSILVLLAAVATEALWMTGNGVSLAIAFNARDLDAATAGLLYGLNNGLFVISWYAIAGMLLAAGAGAFSTHALPTWLAWPALAIGAAWLVAAALPLTGLWFVPYAFFYFWVVAVCVVLVRSSRAS